MGQAKIEMHRCEKCLYWTRHSKRDAAGFCDRHKNSFAMEDDRCSEFTPKEGAK